MHEKVLIDAETLWDWHRAALGGRSSATGAALPETLAGAPIGARAAHHAMAVGIALQHSTELPEPPDGIPAEEVHRIEYLMKKLIPEHPAMEPID